MATPFAGDTANSALENSLAFLIPTLGNRLMRMAERDIRQHLDLAYTEWRVIQIVGSEPGAQPNRIAAITGVNKANISRAVNALEQRGLLDRTSLASHAHHTQLHLTAEGETYYYKGNAMRINAEAKILKGLSAATRRQLGDSLRRMLRNVDKLRNADQTEE